MTSSDTAASAQDAPAHDENTTLQDATGATKPTRGAALADRMDRKLNAATQSIRSVQAQVTAARQQVREVNEASVDYIRQNPWRAISISAGIGLLVGILYSRR